MELMWYIPVWQMLCNMDKWGVDESCLETNFFWRYQTHPNTWHRWSWTAHGSQVTPRDALLSCAPSRGGSWWFLQWRAAGRISSRSCLTDRTAEMLIRIKYSYGFYMVFIANTVFITARCINTSKFVVYLNPSKVSPESRSAQGHRQWWSDPANSDPASDSNAELERAVVNKGVYLHAYQISVSCVYIYVIYAYTKRIYK